MFERVEKVLVSEKARWSYGTLGSEAILVVLETKKKNVQKFSGSFRMSGRKEERTSVGKGQGSSQGPLREDCETVGG